MIWELIENPPPIPAKTHMRSGLYAALMQMVIGQAIRTDATRNEKVSGVWQLSKGSQDRRWIVRKIDGVIWVYCVAKEPSANGAKP